MANLITTGIVTQAFSAVSDTQRHQLGLVVSLDDGGEAIYVNAVSEISQYAYSIVQEDGAAQMATTTNDLTSRYAGWAQQSIPSGYYGWLQISGRPKGNLATNCDDNLPLYTTSTAGVLDDAIVTGHLVLGAVSKVTISNATAVTLLVARGQMVGNGSTATI